MKLVTIDQVGDQIQLDGVPVQLVVDGPGYEISCKHDYPVSIGFTVGPDRFCLDQDWLLDCTTLYECTKDGEGGWHHSALDSVLVPADHAIIQWLKPITA
jgi:hypothetical protein